MTQFDAIFLVDDDPINNLINKRLLSKTGLSQNIREFLGGEDALLLLKEVPDKDHLLIFLDINMPMISGWEFIEKLKTLPDSITEQFSIYMLSSSIDPSDISLLICITLLNDDL